MIHIFAAVSMTFLGCGDALQDCEFISQSNQTYETHAQCEEAIPALLMKMDDTDYPVVTGHCGSSEAKEIVVSAPIADSPIENPESLPTPLAPIDLSKQQGTNSAAESQNIMEANQQPKPLKRVITRIENGFAYVRKGTTNLLTNIGERTRNGLNRMAVGLKLRKEQSVQ